jgi:hypothetical protein
MRYAGPCYGGPRDGCLHAAERSRVAVWKSMFGTIRDMTIAQKMMPDVEAAPVLLGYYVWQVHTQCWKWEAAR